jgi:hypothetical protein
VDALAIILVDFDFLEGLFDPEDDDVAPEATDVPLLEATPDFFFFCDSTMLSSDRGLPFCDMLRSFELIVRCLRPSVFDAGNRLLLVLCAVRQGGLLSLPGG